MNHKIQAFVLHTRPYREHSVLVDFLSGEMGRFSGVFRLTQKNKMLQPFISYQVHWRGQGDLKKISLAQPDGAVYALAGRALYAGLYINELLQRLLAVGCQVEQIMPCYQQALAGLMTQPSDQEPTLRCFEIQLLALLGYGIDFTVCAKTQQAICPDRRYVFIPNQGFIDLQWILIDCDPAWPVCLGQQIQAMQVLQFDTTEIKKLAKSICRMAISSLLGGRPLYTRQLFIRG